MSEEALKKLELEPDDSGETEVVIGEEGYGDQIKVVVPICDDLQEKILIEKKKEFRRMSALLITDIPSRDKEIKEIRRRLYSLESEIAKLEAELEGKNKK